MGWSRAERTHTRDSDSEDDTEGGKRHPGGVLGKTMRQAVDGVG